MNNLKHNTILNLFWKLAERTGLQLVNFIVSIILARLLAPNDYGLIALITIFITLSMVFVQSGFGQSLIQKIDADELDYSSVFYFNIFVAVIMYLTLFFCSGYIANFYNEDLLIPIIRVLGLSVIIGGVNSVQQAYIQKTMQFKRFFYSSIVGTSISAIVSIIAAYNGMGVWALVIQQLTSQAINTVFLWCTVKWRPVFKFSLSRMKSLFGFGSKLFISSMIDTIYNNIYSLIIGKFYSKSDLAYYNRGKQFPYIFISNVNSSIDAVIFPVLSSVQKDVIKLRGMTRRSISFSSFIILPLMTGLAVCSKAVVLLLLTEKWLPCVPFLQFCCFTYSFWPIHTANLQAIKALGKSSIFLKLEIIKKVIGITVLIVTIKYGLYAMMVGRCIVAILSSFINAYPNKKLLNYGYYEQVKDIAPSLLISLVMGGIVYLYNFLNLESWLILLLQAITGVIVYIGLAKLFKIESYDYLLKTLKQLIKSKRKKV